MRSRPLLVALSLLLAVPSPGLRAQDIEPDRPDVTESPATVAPGAVQVETGLALGRESRGGRPDERRLAVEAALRVGSLLPRRLEGYGELFGFTREERDGRERIGVGTGLIYRLAPRLAFDAGVETTEAGAGPKWAVRAGLSARFPR